VLEIDAQKLLKIAFAETIFILALKSLIGRLFRKIPEIDVGN